MIGDNSDLNAVIASKHSYKTMETINGKEE
jgi:hypothetical protein